MVSNVPHINNIFWKDVQGYAPGKHAYKGLKEGPWFRCKHVFKVYMLEM